MRVDLTLYAILYNAQKTNMFQTICVKRAVGRNLQCCWRSASGSDTLCDSVLCNENYRVSDHECVECAPGTIIQVEMMRVVPTLYVIRYNVLKMNMFPSYLPSLDPAGTYNTAGDLLVDRHCMRW